MDAFEYYLRERERRQKMAARPRGLFWSSGDDVGMIVIRRRIDSAARPSDAQDLARRKARARRLGVRC